MGPPGKAPGPHKGRTHGDPTCAARGGRLGAAPVSSNPAVLGHMGGEGPQTEELPTGVGGSKGNPGSVWGVITHHAAEGLGVGGTLGQLVYPQVTLLPSRCPAFSGECQGDSVFLEPSRKARGSRMALTGLRPSWPLPLGGPGGIVCTPFFLLTVPLGERWGTFRVRPSCMEAQLPLSLGSLWGQGLSPPGGLSWDPHHGGLPTRRLRWGGLTWSVCRGRRSKTPPLPAGPPWAGWSGTSWGCACPRGTPCACTGRSHRGRRCTAGSPGSPRRCPRRASRHGSSSVGTKAPMMWGPGCSIEGRGSGDRPGCRVGGGALVNQAGSFCTTSGPPNPDPGSTCP